MSSINNVLNGLISALAFKYINTGDKLLDTAFTGVITYFTAVIITYLTTDDGFYRLYNYCLYNLKYRNTPYELIDYGKFYHLPGRIDNKYIPVPISGGMNSMLLPSYLPRVNNFYNLYRNVELVKILYTDLTYATSGGMSLCPIFITKRGNIVYLYTEKNDVSHRSYTLYALHIEDMYTTLAHIKKYCDTVSNTVDLNKYIFEHEIGEKGVIAPRRLLGRVSERKTFETLFYTQKDELVGMLTKFKEGHLYPDTISMDNKLGILLYGPPGTGKTGTISAIANFLGRGIYTVNLSTPNLTRESMNAILSEEIYKKNIIVFDEFDCMLDVLTVRNQREKEDAANETSKTDWTGLLAAAGGAEEKKQILAMMKEERSKAKNAGLDLAYLLQKLDGIERVDDRVIIATTNNPNHINPVLLRPGRFDIKLCLGNCTRKMYIDIMTSFYKLTPNLLDMYTFPEGKFSPLELINLCLTSKGLDEVLSKLSN